MLSRYETSIERGLFRALHELQRLQAARISQPASESVGVGLNADLSISEDFPTVTEEVAGNEGCNNDNLT
jgi:hypothetical protein